MTEEPRFKPFNSSEHPEKFFAGLTKAILEDDLVVDATRIDRGLRQATIHEKTLRPIMGWGMMPTLRQALIVAELDYLAGNNKFVSHYLIGSSTSEEPLDSWVLEGNDLYCHKDDGRLVIEAISNDPIYHSVAIAEKDFRSAYERLNRKLGLLGAWL